MRKLERLSYSALSLWEKDPQTFFLTRLAGTRTRREPQGLPAAIGSAFDARIKCALARHLWGAECPDDLSFDALYGLQVESQNRTQTLLDDSQLLLLKYVECGRYFDLAKELDSSTSVPRFESERIAVFDGVPCSTKPDLTYALGDVQVIHDWKVKSFYSKSGASPTPGFIRWRGDGGSGPHKKFRPRQWEELTIHDGCLSEFSGAYADQTSMYAWALGVEIGSPFVAQIDEIVCRPGSIRVSELRATVSEGHQRKLLHRLHRCWNAIQMGHVFVDLDFDASQTKQAALERAAQSLGCDADDAGYYAALGRKAWY